MGIKYPQITENGEDGFSEWIKPKMKGYQMACCDCSLYTRWILRSSEEVN